MLIVLETPENLDVQNLDNFSRLTQLNRSRYLIFGKLLTPEIFLNSVHNLSASYFVHAQENSHKSSEVAPTLDAIV